MRQFARKNRITAFLFIKTETRMTKREKPKTTVDTKTEKPGILSAKTEKPISKVTKTAKPKNPMSPSYYSPFAKTHLATPLKGTKPWEQETLQGLP